MAPTLARNVTAIHRQLVERTRMPSTAKIASSGVATVSTGGSRIPRSERPVKGRRGTLYHLSSIIEEQQHGATTLDDVKVRRRFATSRYFLSPAGILKLLVIILFLIAAVVFLSSETCPSAPSWYTWLYPLASFVAFISTAFLYAMFMLGMAEDNPGLWVKLDVAVTLTEAAAVIAISIITITECKVSSHLNNTVLGPLGLAGAALMALSSAATYIMWRYRSQELPAEPTTGKDAPQKSRMSVFI